MDDTELQDVPLQVRRVPDYSVETDEAGHKFKVELPGVFEVGFTLGGVFRPIQTFKASGLLADIARYKLANPDETATVPAADTSAQTADTSAPPTATQPPQ